MTDETRLYDCGELPVDLTLPEKEFLRWDYSDYDYYQYLLDVTIETGDREVGELAAHMRIACDMIEGM